MEFSHNEFHEFHMTAIYSNTLITIIKNIIHSLSVFMSYKDIKHATIPILSSMMIMLLHATVWVGFKVVAFLHALYASSYLC